MPNFYRVSLEGEFQGQDVVNVLWYRSIFGASIADIFGLYTPALAAGVRDQIWDFVNIPFVGARDMRIQMSTLYRLNQITVVPYEENGVLVSSDPYVLPVNVFGEQAGPTNGPASVVNIRYNLGAVLGPGIGLPKRGYQAIGPLLDAAVTDTGRLDNGWLADFQNFANVLASNIETLVPPGVFFPVRVRFNRVAGVVVNIGWKEIDGATALPVAKMRRSRLPEA